MTTKWRDRAFQRPSGTMRGLQVVAFIAGAALSGCESVPSEPPPPSSPSPAMQRLMELCNEGDSASCASVVQTEQAERNRRSALAGVMIGNMLNRPASPYGF